MKKKPATKPTPAAEKPLPLNYVRIMFQCDATEKNRFAASPLMDFLKGYCADRFDGFKILKMESVHMNALLNSRAMERKDSK